jgi:hypothetical protein
MDRIVKRNQGPVKSREDATSKQRLQETAARLNAMLPEHLRPPVVKRRAKSVPSSKARVTEPTEFEYRPPDHLPL